MEVQMKNNTEKRDKYFVDPQSGIVRKVGFCRIGVVEIDNLHVRQIFDLADLGTKKVNSR